MQQLHFVGFTSDHQGLMFSPREDATSGDYFVRIDEYLAAAVEQHDQGHGRNEAKSPAVETTPSPPLMPRLPKPASDLSPREIQARLRSGSSIAEVAREAGVNEDWIARFAAPILAEQSRVVQQAQQLTFDKPRVGLSSQPLRTSVRWNLAEQGALRDDEVFDAGWSAFNVQGSRWVVRFSFVAKRRRKLAEWEVDLRQGSLVARNRVATDLGYVEPGSRRRRPPDQLPPPPPPPRRGSTRSSAKKATAASRAAAYRRPAAKKRPSAGKAVGTRSPAKRITAKKAAARKGTSKKITAKKVTAKKVTAKVPPARKLAGRRAAAGKASGRGSPAKKMPAKKVPGRKVAKRVTSNGSGNRMAAKKAAKAPAAPAAVPAPVRSSPGRPWPSPSPGTSAGGRAPSARTPAQPRPGAGPARSSAMTVASPAPEAPAPVQEAAEVAAQGPRGGPSARPPLVILSTPGRSTEGDEPAAAPPRLLSRQPPQVTSIETSGWSPPEGEAPPVEGPAWPAVRLRPDLSGPGAEDQLESGTPPPPQPSRP